MDICSLSHKHHLKQQQLQTLANNACLDIDTQNGLRLTHHLHWNDQANLGVILITLLGSLLIVFTNIGHHHPISLLMGNLLGVTLAYLGGRTLLRQHSDGLQITKGKLHIRYRSKKSTYPIRQELAISSEQTVFKLRCSPNGQYALTTITLYLGHKGKKIPIFQLMPHNMTPQQVQDLQTDLERLIDTYLKLS